MITKEIITEMRNQTLVPIQALILPILFTFGYLGFSLFLINSEMNQLTFLTAGFLLTPILFYTTFGEVVELIGYSWKLASESGRSLNEVLPTFITKRIRYQSVALLIGAIFVIKLELFVPYYVCLFAILWMGALFS
ncbi:hypothetical protein WMO40_12695 [Bacillaceae bacterium CLA-AA-H227]|uniref:Uncharacterized protein n=2 Tax=Robertmurraya TaxID=2837507 RepID=A0A4U1CZ23_9BACI|nr:hypothetical protein [Robertmurraya kyonggiensis]TKC15142.1 hypothetical protein FA727_19865 [Robertmurraya kyonggiensis]